jgi:hypothetical protein
LSWPKDGPIHYRTGTFILVTTYAMKAPIVYCQAMNPIQVRKRTTRRWDKVTCKNCKAKLEREVDQTARMYQTTRLALHARS